MPRESMLQDRRFDFLNDRGHWKDGGVYDVVITSTVSTESVVVARVWFRLDAFAQATATEVVIRAYQSDPTWLVRFAFNVELSEWVLHLDTNTGEGYVAMAVLNDRPRAERRLEIKQNVPDAIEYIFACLRLHLPRLHAEHAAALNRMGTPADLERMQLQQRAELLSIIPPAFDVQDMDMAELERLALQGDPLPPRLANGAGDGFFQVNEPLYIDDAYVLPALAAVCELWSIKAFPPGTRYAIDEGDDERFAALTVIGPMARVYRRDGSLVVNPDCPDASNQTTFELTLNTDEAGLQKFVEVKDRKEEELDARRHRDGAHDAGRCELQVTEIDYHGRGGVSRMPVVQAVMSSPMHDQVSRWRRGL